MARRARVRRAVKRHKDLVWITSIMDASLLESTPTDILDVVLSGDWSLGNTGFDRCTLIAVRGWMSATQTTASTAGESTAVYGAMYVTNGDVPSNSMDPSVATEFVTNDTIWTYGMGLGSMTASVGIVQHNWELQVKAKRKLSTASRVSIAAVVAGADTGTPRVSFNGCVRALLMLDPPG